MKSRLLIAALAAIGSVHERQVGAVGQFDGRFGKIERNQGAVEDVRAFPQFAASGGVRWRRFDQDSAPVLDLLQIIAIQKAIPKKAVICQIIFNPATTVGRSKAKPTPPITINTDENLATFR